MVHYVALIRQATNREFTVCFPDLPACGAIGDSPEASIRQPTEALDADDTIGDGVTAVRVPPPPPPEGRVVRLTVALPTALLDRTDDTANNRTGFLLEAAERLLAERARPARRGRILRM